MSSKESNWKKFFGSRLFIVVALVIAVMVVVGYVRSYYQDYQVRSQIGSLQAQARDLEGKKLELLEALKYVKSDDFVEEKARTEFNMVKPGEQVVVISSTMPVAQDRQVQNNMIALSNIPNYIKWWKYFVDGDRPENSN